MEHGAQASRKMNTYVLISALAIGILLSVSRAHSKRCCCCRKRPEVDGTESGGGAGGGGNSGWQIDNRGDIVSGESGGNLSSEMRRVLDMHNKYRRQVAQGQVPGQPGSTKIHDLKWNDELARMAQEFTDRCEIRHNTFEERATKTFPDVGQSIAVYSSIEMCVEKWFEEHKDYNYNLNSCTPGKACGHYTQLVRANTTDLGCGVNKCDYEGYKLYFLVCHYGPYGAYPDQRPY